MIRLLGLALAVCCALLLGPRPAVAQQDFSFMPQGGKGLLVEFLGGAVDAAALRPIVRAQRSEPEWTAFLEARESPLGERERRTLAAYLAVNMPLDGATLEAVETADDPVAALPPDGRELAWNHCQFCHSLFTSYLTQERNVAGWLGTFETPHHREIAMNAKERETFARYSAANMPMKFADVPEDLRF